MTNDAFYEWLTEVEAENRQLRQQLFAARAEIADLAKLKAKVADFEAEITLLRVS